MAVADGLSMQQGNGDQCEGLLEMTTEPEIGGYAGFDASEIA
jgi:hypothetical protein